ncbi:bacteriocin [Pseudoalteromonas luteoviolacea]|nr:bacteriocin [Pseudoalteromonas luteoviolacea]MCF6441204.1 bacteriocin [Pseudoalteromonas luteoviolacea]
MKILNTNELQSILGGMNGSSPGLPHRAQAIKLTNNKPASNS